ncbi:hypothetical protein GCM10023210_32770 [Chryseobacterium ginsengisoli]|uniref:RHS repeat-associated core domain-containing protein n=1 Tax=Chryseobacterium ginsengisoli TaxID=363853 RepID=A0ABP9MJ99_9FLAO
MITETFEYDNQNRLLVHKHKVDNNTEEILVQNTYNDILQLSNKKVGGIDTSTPLQSIDYSYNIRGWMTKINDPANLGGKLFGYKIKYNEVEGQETPNMDFTNLKVKPKYNGNIAEVDWRTGTVTGDYLRRYGYVYDSVNRLSAGFYQKDTNPSAKEYFEKMDYDVNGNITYLKRSGAAEGTTATNIDDLAYIYSGNRLTSVTDSSTDYRGYPDTSGNNIPYDINGNMTSQKDKGILLIDYNFLNLPNYLKFNSGLSTRTGMINENTNYLYRADGSKLRKTFNYAPYNPLGTITQLSTKVTEYLDGFQYEGSGKKGTSIVALKFVPTAEGYYNFENNKYIYNYTDHLGNVRLSYFKNGTSAEVIEENNYYPFGMKHEGYNPTAGNPAYTYSYNGKELQTESGMYDYGARFYMSDIGRWGVVDPLAEKMRRWNPYNYAYNNPIRFIDPDGMFAIPPDDHFNQFGQFLYTDNKTTNNIIIDFQNPITGKLNTAPWLSTELKDYRFNKENMQTLINIGNYYADQAGVDVVNLRNQSVSVAMWNDKVYSGGSPDRDKGEYKTFNGGNYCYDCLMNSNKEENVITIQVNEHKVNSKLNNKGHVSKLVMKNF